MLGVWKHVRYVCVYKGCGNIGVWEHRECQYI